MHWIQLQYHVEKKQEDFSACKGLQARIRKRNSEKCHVCDTCRRLGYFVSVFSWIVSNPHYFYNHGEMNNFYFGGFTSGSNACLKRESNQNLCFYICRKCGQQIKTSFMERCW